jgi:hypothetical protein
MRGQALASVACRGRQKKYESPQSTPVAAARPGTGTSVLGVQSLPAAELHRLAANDAADESSAEKVMAALSTSAASAVTDHTLDMRRIARNRFPQLRHRKARSANTRNTESTMLLVWDRRVLCQPHRGQIGRSGSVSSSTSS